MRTAAPSHISGVRIEHSVIMRLPILGEGLNHSGIRLVTISLEAAHDHPQTTGWHNRSFERRFGLKTYDYLFVAFDVTRRVGKDVARDLGDIEIPLATIFKKLSTRSIPNVIFALPRARGRKY